jgi:GTP-binding protein
LAVHALDTLAELGPLIRESKLDPELIKMPWLRLMQAANQCEGLRRKGKLSKNSGGNQQPNESGGGVDKQLAMSPGDDVVPGLLSKSSTASTESTTTTIPSLPCNLAHSVLSVMSTFPSDNDDKVYEALSNALVRRVIFIKGAVDMTGLPPADRGEVAFIGRSNVGKSSLINMITNRKALAYISRTPGKTQEFNYFAVNDKPLKEKEIKYGDTIDGEPDDDTFYLVDLPGFGFARVPDAQRKDWANFMENYLSNRKSLKVVFHLIDSRHGPIDEDSNIMKQISTNLPKSVSYVVVLTKADKNIKKNNSNPNINSSKRKNQHGWVSSDVMTKVRDTMQSNGVGNAPVLLTSSETKLGRDHLWRYIRLAAES